MACSIRSLAIVGGLWLVAPMAQAGLVLDISGGQTSLGANGPTATAGYTFTVNSSVQVDALGFWDEGSNGLTQSHDIGIWSNAGANPLLASVTVPSGSGGMTIASAGGSGSWIFAAISALTLGPGSYTIGATFASVNTDAVRFLVPTVTTEPEIAYGAGVQVAAAGLVRPTLAIGADASLFGPTFHTVDVQGVPEPASLAIAALGLCGLVLTRRRAARA